MTPSRVTASAIAAMIGAEASMPVLAAPIPMSVATDSIWSATVCGGNSWIPLTPSEFWTVTAVMADMPWTWQARKVLRSA